MTQKCRHFPKVVLAIDTSCDETSVAVTCGRRVLSNELYSQVLEHKQWGGVMPILAKRAHEERIDSVIESALKKAKVTMSDIDYIAVTFGPGLAIALGVGIDKAMALAREHNIKLIPINHMEGHIYSCFAQNSKGNPDTLLDFPYLALLVSGVHTEIVIFKDHLQYQVLGKTLDDAAGEALDKGARLILNEHIYPGGPIIEKLALKGDPKAFAFPRPMKNSKNLDFSYSGLKTSLLYQIRSMSDQERIAQMHNLAASFQEAVFQSIMIKLEMAIQKSSISKIIVGGGVSANEQLRKNVRKIAQKYHGEVLFPQKKELNGDNAAMIGVVAYYKILEGQVLGSDAEITRNARAVL